MGKVIALFDVDGTLTAPRKVGSAFCRDQPMRLF
jgi:hypothetical protein